MGHLGIHVTNISDRTAYVFSSSPKDKCQKLLTRIISEYRHTHTYKHKNTKKYVQKDRTHGLKAGPNGNTWLVSGQSCGFSPGQGLGGPLVRCGSGYWSGHPPQEHQCRTETVLPLYFWTHCRKSLLPSIALLSPEIIHKITLRLSFWLYTMSLGIVRL